MFDITSQAVSDTAPLHLKSAKGEFLYADAAKEKPVRIHLYGPGSKPFAAIEAKQSQRALTRMQANDDKITIAPPEERKAATAEDLAAITVSFENFVYPKAGDKQGIELFQMVYADPSLGFIVKQVTKFISDWGNFSGGSATA